MSDIFIGSLLAVSVVEGDLVVRSNIRFPGTEVGRFFGLSMRDRTMNGRVALCDFS